MSNLPHAVRVDGGKYTFVREALSIKVLRHGEPWHEQQHAFNALASIMYELDAARVVLAAARSLEKRGEAPMELRQAIRLHEALVSDSEHPSEWAVPSEPVTEGPCWGCHRERREAFVDALKFDERIWRAYLLLKPIHRDGLLDALERAALVGAP